MDDRNKNRFLEGGPVLFQVYLTKKMISKRLEILRLYSYNAPQVAELYNCFNLTFALLGLVHVDPTNPFNFCVNKGFPTQWNEVVYYINAALMTCGLPPGVQFIEGYTAEFLEHIFSYILPNYGTLFPIFSHSIGMNHVVLLHKDNNGRLSLIDSQARGFDGKYPLKINGADEIWRYLSVSANSVAIPLTNAIIRKTQSLNNLCQILNPSTAVPLQVNDEPMLPQLTMNDEPMIIPSTTNDDDPMEGLSMMNENNPMEGSPGPNNHPMEEQPADAGAGRKRDRKTRKNRKYRK